MNFADAFKAIAHQKHNSSGQQQPLQHRAAQDYGGRAPTGPPQYPGMQMQQTSSAYAHVHAPLHYPTMPCGQQQQQQYTGFISSPSFPPSQPYSHPLAGGVGGYQYPQHQQYHQQQFQQQHQQPHQQYQQLQPQCYQQQQYCQVGFARPTYPRGPPPAPHQFTHTTMSAGLNAAAGAPGPNSQAIRSLSESYRNRANLSPSSSAKPKSSHSPATAMVPAAAGTTETMETFYCESCDKEFAARAQYDTHVATHEQCQHRDPETGATCAFRGTRKVVQAHFHLAHGLYSGSGFKDIVVEGQKFCVLLGTSEADVAQWRAERKRRFPTRELVAKREDDRERHAQAGGLDALSASTDGNGTARRDGDAPKSKSKEPRPPMLCSFFVHSKCTKTTEECRFAHDDVRRAALAPCTAYSRRHYCRNGYKCRFLHVKGKAGADAEEGEEGDKAVGSERSQEPKAKKARKVDKNAIPRPLDGLDGRGSLLGRLLRSEAEEEANILLQCFRYFVSNDFFVPLLGEGRDGPEEGEEEEEELGTTGLDIGLEDLGDEDDEEDDEEEEVGEEASVCESDSNGSSGDGAGEAGSDDE